MRTRIAIIATLVLLSGVMTNVAQAQSYGTELPFVLGTSTRSSAMGVTSVSFMPDAAIQFYNPSVMSSLQWKQFSFSRTTLFESSSLYHTLSYSHPTLNHGTIGVSILRIDVSGIEERDQSNQLLSSDLHDSQTRILLGYGRNIGSSFAAGFNMVFDNHSFGSYTGSGVGLDVGISAQQRLSGNSMIRGIREGFVIRNVLEPTVKLDRDPVSDPMDIGVGLSVLSVIGNMRMVTAMNLVNPRYSPASFRLGQEFTYADHYSLRVGVDDATPTFGAGADYKNFTLDYAFRSEDFGDNHRISLAIRFGRSLDARRAQARLSREEKINETVGTRMEELEQDQITNSLAEGKILLQQGDYEAARSRFEITLLWAPDNEEAKELAAKAQYNQAIQLGHQAIGKDDYAGALVNFKNALRLYPDDSDALRLIATCNQHLAADANHAATINKLLNTAIDLYAERRFGEALSGFNEVLKINHQHALAIEYREKCQINIRSQVQRLVAEARSLAKRDDYESAIRLLEQALAYDPNDVTILVEIERCNKILPDGRATEATPPLIVEPKTQSVLQPQVSRPALERKYNEGMRSFNKGDFNAAIKSLSEVWSQDPDFHNVSPLLVKTYLLVGMNHYSEQQYSKAIQVWERALAVDPSNSKARRYISKANEIVKKLDGGGYER
jgi:tetratricopeptide (TPR) repeat protein